jgi:hypothetical protein
MVNVSDVRSPVCGGTCKIPRVDGSGVTVTFPEPNQEEKKGFFQKYEQRFL